MKYIVLQSEQSSKKFVGGKAASLLKLKREGFNVPPFFILTVQSANWLNNGKNCKRLYPKIMEAYGKTIRHGTVAVRSSATVEDLRASSFAGQFRTVLNTDIDNVCFAIRTVYSSMPRVAKTYKGIIKTNTKVGMAVIVQKMVNPEKAGIIFTADPVASNRGRMVVEVVPGLGEALVSGTKTPIRYYISRKSNKIVNQKSGTLMSAKELKQLCTIALSIEKLFEYPQDIEFAIRKGNIYILQSRDITTL